MDAPAGHGWRATLAIAFALLAALAAPSAASALTLQGLSAQPANTAAGANTNFSINIGFGSASDQVKDLTIHLPPGLVGNPTVTPLCTVAQLNADSCPAASDVGDTTTSALLLGLIPLTVPGDIYNLTPQAGEPARFGIVLRPISVPPLPTIVPPIILQSGASLRTSDFGLDTSLKDLPNAASGVSLDITNVSLTLAGMAGSPPRGFIRNPTSCGAAITRFDATSYASPTTVSSGQASFTPTACSALPFTPELSARMKRIGAANQPHELSTTIAQTIDEAGLKSAQVTLPSGVGANNDALNAQCPRASFAAGTCPAASIVGAAVAASPLLTQPLTGPVALVQPTAPGLPDIGLDLKGPLALKLVGSAGIAAGGRNVVTFAGLPDIPISQFTLTFNGGPGGLIVASRDVCEPPAPVFDAAFASHSGATANVPAAAAIEGCGAPGTKGKKPTAKLRLAGTGSDEPRLRLKLKAGSERIAAAKLRLPRQLAFAGGSKFADGVEASADGDPLGGKAVKRKKRRLGVRIGGNGARSVKAKVANGALVLTAEITRRMKFPISVKDTTGHTTKLVARAPR